MLRKNVVRHLLAVLAISSGAGLTAAGENWPHWRGPSHDGTSKATDLPLEWGPERNIVWKAPLPA